MSLDYDGILDKFITVAREALPTELSFIGPLADIPAVIRARQTGPKPSYPYLTVDVLDTSDESGWLNNEHIDASDFTVVETNKQLLLSYRVYGGNAINIANNLHGYFRLNRVLGDIRSTLGGSVVTTSGIDQLPILLADEYLESASFTLIFNITDTFVDSAGSDAFDTVNLEGELFEHVDDTTPLGISITVPTP
jgi:hypothetical protein